MSYQNMWFNPMWSATFQASLQILVYRHSLFGPWITQAYSCHSSNKLTTSSLAPDPLKEKLCNVLWEDNKVDIL